MSYKEGCKGKKKQGCGWKPTPGMEGGKMGDISTEAILCTKEAICNELSITLRLEQENGRQEDITIYATGMEGNVLGFMDFSIRKEEVLKYQGTHIAENLHGDAFLHVFIEDFLVHHPNKGHGIGNLMFQFLLEDAMPVYCGSIGRHTDIVVEGELWKSHYHARAWEVSVPFYFGIAGKVGKGAGDIQSIHTYFASGLWSNMEQFSYDSSSKEHRDMESMLGRDGICKKIIRELAKSKEPASFAYHIVQKA